MEHPSNKDRLLPSQANVTLRWDQAPMFGRKTTLLKSLRRLHGLHPASVCIVETGTLRDDRPQACNGDGWSTLAFGWYAAQTGGQAYTVDISVDAIAVCKRLTAEVASHLDYVCADSRAFLQAWVQEQRGDIHLLYLD